MSRATTAGQAYRRGCAASRSGSPSAPPTARCATPRSMPSSRASSRRSARSWASSGVMQVDPGPGSDMTYTYERPDLKSLQDLERVLRHIGEEAGGWRRRALAAEAELQEARQSGGVVA